MSDGFSIVEPAGVPPEQFNTCETAVRKLTEPLGCVELRVNPVVVEPGGQIAIAGETYDVPREASAAYTRPQSGTSATRLPTRPTSG